MGRWAETVREAAADLLPLLRVEAPDREAVPREVLLRADAPLREVVLAGACFAAWLPPVLLRAADGAVVFFLVAPLRDAVDGFFAVERPVEVFFCAICYLK